MQDRMREAIMSMPRKHMYDLMTQISPGFVPRGPEPIFKRERKGNKKSLLTRLFTKMSFQSELDQTYVYEGVLVFGIPRIQRALTLLRVIWAF